MASGGAYGRGRPSCAWPSGVWWSATWWSWRGRRSTPCPRRPGRRSTWPCPRTTEWSTWRRWTAATSSGPASGSGAQWATSTPPTARYSRRSAVRRRSGPKRRAPASSRRSGGMASRRRSTSSRSVCRPWPLRVRLRFLPDGAEVRVPSGTPVFDAASWNAIAIDSTCGGHGTCKKCRVRIVSGDVPVGPLDPRAFTAEELRDGWRLACRAGARGDLVVEVPPLHTRPKAALAPRAWPPSAPRRGSGCRWSCGRSARPGWSHSSSGSCAEPGLTRSEKASGPRSRACSGDAATVVGVSGDAATVVG